MLHSNYSGVTRTRQSVSFPRNFFRSSNKHQAARRVIAAAAPRIHGMRLKWNVYARVECAFPIYSRANPCASRQSEIDQLLPCRERADEPLGELVARCN